MKVQVLDHNIFALIDTGCEVSIMNEHLYNQLKHQGLNCLELPTQHVNLLSAFSNKSNRIRRQALLSFKIEAKDIHQVVLLSPQLVTDVILGLDFLMDYVAIINFSEKSMSLSFRDESVKVQFFSRRETDEVGQAVGLNPETDIGDSRVVSWMFPIIGVRAADFEELRRVGGNGTHYKEAEGRVKVKDENIQPIKVKAGLVIPRQMYYEKSEEFTSRYAGRCLNNSSEVRNLTKDSARQASDRYGMEEWVKGGNGQNQNIAEADTDVCVMKTDLETANIDVRGLMQGIASKHLRQDDRDVTIEELLSKTRECSNLSNQQQTELYGLLVKYQPYLTKRPGRCNTF